MEGISNENATKALQAEMYAQELRRLEQEYNSIMVRIKEVEDTIKALDNFVRKKEFNAMVPVGAGIYLDAEIKNVDNIVMSLTSKYAMKMDINDAREFLKQQMKNLEDVAKKIEEEFVKLESEFNRLVNELQQTQASEK